MEVIKRIRSNSDNQHIDIVQQGSSFSLELYETKYDEEEGCEYTVRVFPDPSGQFETEDLAIREAKFLMFGKVE
ncbi:hypothetical protein PSI9734_02059 [Pseudidiomarina piscicola]|uniref:Uncharacterized protein n=1 Tax=Pseudidiomarina piscicola TaxID=2614830 RepID=A0A6S6WNZ4_9GAMM|nr:hypothetical protein [Pseudidiomarina piscicola]CAB0151691.1 hypothetical protein PSI9734_02059 [Pseudidiomarina piscicola]VZT41149.1 hypothetical protein PSI9734_02059 [Pseudomonas aeruginosa]